MMQSKKNVKSDEEFLAKKTLETSDYVGLKETCPFQDQQRFYDDDSLKSNEFHAVHCRSDCAWYSDDACIVWDLAIILRRIASQQEHANTR